MDFVVPNVNDCLFEQAFMAVDDYDSVPHSINSYLSKYRQPGLLRTDLRCLHIF